MFGGLNATTLISTAITSAVNGATLFIVVRIATRASDKIEGNGSKKKKKRRRGH